MCEVSLHANERYKITSFSLFLFLPNTHNIPVRADTACQVRYSVEWAIALKEFVNSIPDVKQLPNGLKRNLKTDFGLIRAWPTTYEMGAPGRYEPMYHHHRQYFKWTWVSDI